jgi:hypothetical protein
LTRQSVGLANLAVKNNEIVNSLPMLPKASKLIALPVNFYIGVAGDWIFSQGVIRLC